MDSGFFLLMMDVVKSLDKCFREPDKPFNKSVRADKASLRPLNRALGIEKKRLVEKMGTIYQKREYWYYQYTVNAKRKAISLKTKDSKVAKKLKKFWDAELASKKALINLEKQMKNVGSDPLDGSPQDWIARRWNSMNPREKLAVIFSLFKGKCFYCGCDVKIPLRREKKHLPDNAVLDHFRPVVGGGSDSFSNIVLACNDCNLKKLDKDPADFKIDLVQETLFRENDC